GVPVPASAPPAAAPPPWPWAVAAGSSGAGPARGRPAAPTPRTGPGGGAPPAAAGPRSPLFLHDLLEHLLVQGQLGDETLEALGLDLQLLETLGVVGLHAAVLSAPAVERLLADGQLLADLADGQAGGQIDLRGAELGDDLLRGMFRHRRLLGLKGLQR